MARRYRTMTKCVEVDAEVDIEFGDIIEYVEDYADDAEKKELALALSAHINPTFYPDNGSEGGFIREQKTELLSLAALKYSLEELEARLGTKFDLL